jgi:hypothetical protein
MTKTMGIVRTDRVLVIITLDDCVKVEHHAWDKKLAGWGYDPRHWLVYEENCGCPLEETDW